MRSYDFERIHAEFVDYYKSPQKGDREYYDWLNALGLNESKPYGQAREEFRWAANMLRFLKEDADNKYYGIIVGLPIRSMNGNVYRERDLIAAALTLKGKSPSVNHKDEFWLSPKNPRNRWGTVSVEDAKYEDGAVEAILKVPKSATCPVCPRPNSRLTELIDGKYIVNVSLEGTMEGAFQFSDPPFTLLTSDVLPGIPLARIKPLEKIMVEALQFQQLKGEKKVKIKATVKEDHYMPEPQTSVTTTTAIDPASLKGIWGTPVSSDTALHTNTDSSGNTTVPVGTSPASIVMKSSHPDANVPHHEPSPATAKAEAAVKEPFGGYTDFADCVAKNSDKDNPQAYCGSIKAKTESTPPSYDGVPPGGGQPAPVYGGGAGGTDRTQAPSRNIPEAGGLPNPADYGKVMGESPASIGVKMGSAPVELLVEERKARIKADLAKATAEERALKFEEEYTKTFGEMQRHIGENTALKQSNSELTKLRDESVRELANKEVERDQWRKKYEHQLSIATELTTQLENSKTEVSRLTEKYGKQMDINLELSKKATAANEDYLAIAKKLEATEEALGRAKNEAKRITRLTV